MLVPKERAYFLNEAVPINEKSMQKKSLTDEKKQEAVVKELENLGIVMKIAALFSYFHLEAYRTR